jgi:hypothetical protein
MHRYRKPAPKIVSSYWLSASNYYMLAIAISFAAFFLVMGLLRDGREEPLIPAGIAASAVLVAAVIVRRAILKKLQMRAYAARRLEHNLTALRLTSPLPETKLTIEKNASIIRELKRKSDAAMVLLKFPEGHREVFELSGQYLEINEREMQSVNPGSPRIAALRRGKEIAEDFHRRHMLKWAEIETTSLLEDAQTAVKASEKIDLAAKALGVIQAASSRYPGERKLLDSATAIGEFITKAKVTDLVERAAKAERRGNAKLAVKHFRNALAELDTATAWDRDRQTAAERIKKELERLADSELK